MDEYRIAHQLNLQPTDGGVQPHRLDDALLHRTINRQWQRIDELWKQLDLQRPNKKLLGEFVLAHEKKQICEELLRLGDDETSGRLLLDHYKGQRVIKWRGKKEINAQYRVAPMLLLDATLPDIEILKHLHENIKVVADINVPLPPSVFIRQLLGAPTTESKLLFRDPNKKKANEKHRHAVKRYILKRFHETGRQKTLVICQQEFHSWLVDKLPKEINFLHYNNLVGVDAYRDVRLLFLIGRTQPGPDAAEANAGALTGAMPAPATYCKPPTNFVFYDPTLRVINLKNGSGVSVWGDAHPDALCEEIRWQICERELLQALGRARAGNRTPETPLDVELLFNTALVTVDEAVRWAEPSLLWETIAEGVVLTSAVDLRKAWPKIWSNATAATRTLKEPLPALPGWTKVTYQLAGRRMNQRTAYFDTGRVPDPRGWLTARLGPLKP
jgi:hypothetical protein